MGRRGQGEVGRGCNDEGPVEHTNRATMLPVLKKYRRRSPPHPDPLLPAGEEREWDAGTGLTAASDIQKSAESWVAAPRATNRTCLVRFWRTSIPAVCSAFCLSESRVPNSIAIARSPSQNTTSAGNHRSTAGTHPRGNGRSADQRKSSGANSPSYGLSRSANSSRRASISAATKQKYAAMNCLRSGA